MGGSSSRWLLLNEQGDELGSGVALPITGHVFTKNGREENLSRLREVLRAAVSVAQPNAAVGGVAGLHGGTDAAALFWREVCENLGLAPEKVHLDNDMSVAYAGVFRPGEGVLIYAGTGSIAYHLRRDGEVIRAGGYGYLVDDAGGGFWIGQQGLRQVLRWFDQTGRPETRPLACEVYEALGHDDWDDLIGIIYGGGRRQVAALAPAVARAARAGDEVAVAILERAGAELAALTRTVLTRSGETLPVVFMGGVAQLSPLLTHSLRSRLPENPFRRALGEPVRSAARLALELARATSNLNGKATREALSDEREAQL